LSQSVKLEQDKNRFLRSTGIEVFLLRYSFLPFPPGGLFSSNDKRREREVFKKRKEKEEEMSTQIKKLKGKSVSRSLVGPSFLE
jgi:hypothetical protein